MLDDLAFFVAIVEAGSLSAAAQQAGMPASTLTRRLQKLERSLGCRLLHRSARRMLPIAEGWQYYEQCRPLVQALLQTTARLDDTLNQAAGVLRVLAPVNLANGLLAPAWTGFLERYPAIRLELQLSNRTEDLVGSHGDLAIRTGVQNDSSLNQRKLGAIAARLVAAPAYLARRGLPEQPEQLALHDLLVAEPLAFWSLRHRSGTGQFKFSPTARVRVNDLQLAVNAALSGLGILFCPLNLCHAELARGELVEVLPDWQAPSRDIYAIWPQRRFVPARVRALIEYLVEFAAGEPLFVTG
ncbi:LysR family transcriptional regulator [Metapseudomonas resinovorans]|uniref:LysR family transcriptional regulator n=1 Tax=Metapseudomonas resinovorans TaxID=53412 RepID=UPI000986377F|nr:LysR family transcriptional regulator [Pseudomonas resinovorans]